MPSGSQRLVWITGAGSGIGRALALEYGANGYRVIVSGRESSSLNHVHNEILGKGGHSTVIHCDVRDESSVQSAVKKMLENTGIPDILVNNAGVTVFKNFADTSIEEFDNIVSTNLRGPFLTTKALLAGMVQRGSGIILNVVSFAAKTTYTKSSVYAASKAGVGALMEGLRAEVRDSGVKIVNVYPGAVLTPIWHPKVRTSRGDKMLSPEEAAKMILAISCQPPSMMVEEIVIRPQGGDISA